MWDFRKPLLATFVGVAALARRFFRSGYCNAHGAVHRSPPKNFCCVIRGCYEEYLQEILFMVSWSDAFHFIISIANFIAMTFEICVTTIFERRRINFDESLSSIESFCLARAIGAASVVLIRSWTCTKRAFRKPFLQWSAEDLLQFAGFSLRFIHELKPVCLTSASPRVVSDWLSGVDYVVQLPAYAHACIFRV